MSLWCDHDWQPRSGMNSGSYCPKCQSHSDKEVGVWSSLGSNQLASKEKTSGGRLWSNMKEKMGMCAHNWTPRSGMDSGSYCTKCTALSDKEVVISPESTKSLGLGGHSGENGASDARGAERSAASFYRFDEEDTEMDALLKTWTALNDNAIKRSAAEEEKGQEAATISVEELTQLEKEQWERISLEEQKPSKTNQESKPDKSLFFKPHSNG